MLDLARPNVDLTMECLAMLPKHPMGVSLDALAKDLGFENQRDVRKLFCELKAEHGIKVVIFRDDLSGAAVEPGYRAGVEDCHWRRAKELAEKYLDI